MYHHEQMSVRYFFKGNSSFLPSFPSIFPISPSPSLFQSIFPFSCVNPSQKCRPVERNAENIKSNVLNCSWIVWMEKFSKEFGLVLYKSSFESRHTHFWVCRDDLSVALILQCPMTEFVSEIFLKEKNERWGFCWWKLQQKVDSVRKQRHLAEQVAAQKRDFSVTVGSSGNIFECFIWGISFQGLLSLGDLSQQEFILWQVSKLEVWNQGISESHYLKAAGDNPSSPLMGMLHPGVPWLVETSLQSLPS